MKKILLTALAIAGLLLFLSAVIMVLIRQINDLPEDIRYQARIFIILGLFLGILPILAQTYLFQQQKIIFQIIAPVIALLTVMIGIGILLSSHCGCAAWQICIFLPTLGIAGATVITAYLPAVRQSNAPISPTKLTLGVTAELLLGIALPPAIAFLLFLTK